MSHTSNPQANYAWGSLEWMVQAKKGTQQSFLRWNMDPSVRAQVSKLMEQLGWVQIRTG